MDERTCETCKHEDKTNGQAPCSICETETGNMWEPKDTAEYVQELLEQKYGGYGRKNEDIERVC